MRQEKRKLAREIGHEVREGMNKNFERGLSDPFKTLHKR
jgi:hypothetical protein